MGIRTAFQTVGMICRARLKPDSAIEKHVKRPKKTRGLCVSSVTSLPGAFRLVVDSA
jgi:hypothetical protein